MAITKDQIMEVKGRGFLRNRGTECFSGRIVGVGTVFTGDEIIAIGELAKEFGNGKVSFTSRLTAEVVGIPFERIPEAEKFAAEHNLHFGGTGAKVRPVTSCKGTTCVYGNYDTQALATEIHNKFYVGWADVKLPHKFKISVGGCPNSCVKPSLNDFGVEGHRKPIYDNEKCKKCKKCNVEEACPIKVAKLGEDGLVIGKDCIDCGNCIGKCPFDAVAPEAPVEYTIFVGGTWGKKTRAGTPLSRRVSADEILPILEKCILWFKDNAQPKERFGAAIDRIGFDKLEAYLFD